MKLWKIGNAYINPAQITDIYDLGGDIGVYFAGSTTEHMLSGSDAEALRVFLANDQTGLVVDISKNYEAARKEVAA